MADHGATGYAALDPCVHCGFCLPACPTYLATGDENDSPRGRIVLMRALERGTLTAADPALRTHLEACLGCRGCEPACPSGVGYGLGLEAARRQLAAANGIGLRVRLLLTVFGHQWLWRAVFGVGRLFRTTGLAGSPLGGRLGAMLASTSRTPVPADQRPKPAPDHSTSPPVRQTVLLFRGCVMDVLFDHVHAATRRVLEANGYRVVDAPGLVCCGATHEHAGDAAGARRLAERNVASLPVGVDWMAVNSAGCGAVLKDYGYLLGTDGAREFSSRVKDVTELLAMAGPRPGTRLDLDVAYDAPCHLQHAQGVHADVLAILGAVPGLRIQVLPGHDRCCGGAGLYTLVQRAMSNAVLAEKVAAIRDVSPRPALVTTGNPGCIMQIGAGLRVAGLRIPVVHPVEVLDWSYRGS